VGGERGEPGDISRTTSVRVLYLMETTRIRPGRNAPVDGKAA